MRFTLTEQTYLEAFKTYPSHAHIQSGTIEEFLRDSVVKYYPGKCPVYQVEHYHNGEWAAIGGNYASNCKPKLVPGESLDFD